MSSDIPTTDLVERLRDMRAGDAVTVACLTDDLCIEAADEIERLRSIIRELQETVPSS
jgi:hypothetical protein